MRVVEVCVTGSKTHKIFMYSTIFWRLPFSSIIWWVLINGLCVEVTCVSSRLWYSWLVVNSFCFLFACLGNPGSHELNWQSHKIEPERVHDSLLGSELPWRISRLAEGLWEWIISQLFYVEKLEFLRLLIVARLIAGRIWILASLFYWKYYTLFIVLYWLKQNGKYWDR